MTVLDSGLLFLGHPVYSIDDVMQKSINIIWWPTFGDIAGSSNVNNIIHQPAGNHNNQTASVRHYRDRHRFFDKKL